MGFFDSLMGNASNVDPQKVVRELAKDQILLEAEQVQRAFRLFRDLVVFTDWRIIAIDVQGLSGKKRSYQTIPYSSISRFSVETAGTLDLDDEIDVFISSAETPVLAMQIRENPEALRDIQIILARALRG